MHCNGPLHQVIIIDRKVKQRWKGTYIEAGEFDKGEINK